MKKLISIFLCILLISAAAPVNVFAEVTETSGSYEDKMTWEYDKDTKTLTVNCDGPLDFPYRDVYEYMEGPVFLYRAYPWNENGINSEAEHIVLKGNVTEIGKYVFMNFYKLTELSVPETVKTIGALAFRGCGFEEIDIPSNVKRIEGSAFSNCNKLKTVTLHEGLEYIGGHAFDSLKLEQINIPESVKMTGIRIAGTNFNDGLKQIIQSEGGFCYIDNCIIECQNGVEDAVIREGTRFVPENLYYTFGSDSFKSLYVPSSVKIIGDRAFYGCILEKVTIENGVENIGEEAFCSNGKLTELNIGDSVKTIKKGAFEKTGMTSVKLPSGLEVIEANAFAKSKLKTVKIPASVKKIYAAAFDGADVEKITVDKDNQSYSASGNVLFNKAKTVLVYYPAKRAGKHYKVPAGVKNIYSDFSASALQTVTLPKTVKKLTRYISKALYYFGSQSEWEKVKKAKKTNGYNESTEQGAYVCTAKLSKKKYTYNGMVRKPGVKVYDPAGNLLTEKKDYSVTYPKGRKKINEYTVKVKLKGDFKGTINLNFSIIPEATAFAGITTGGAKFTAKWKKVKKNISGYEIQFSKNQRFLSNSETKVYTLKKDKTKKTFKNLYVKTPYYIRVRTFKTVNKKRIYSAWSKSEKVVISSPY